MPRIGLGIDIARRGAGISWQAYCTTLIMSLNPIVYVKDMAVVVDGKLVDDSGNNKEIAVSTVTLVNDTITMPASDADIIAALIADGMYDFWYTDDVTPKAIQIGNMMLHGSRRMFSFYDGLHFCLFANELTQAQQESLYSALSIPKAYLPDVNFSGNDLDQLIINPANPVTGAKYIPFFSSGNANVVIIDNAFSWSESKKTRTRTLEATSNIRYAADCSITLTGGNYKISFWLNRTQIIPGDVVVMYHYSSHAGGTSNSMWWTAAQLNSLATTKTGTIDGYTYNTYVKDIQGDWSRIEMNVAARCGITNNLLSYNTINFQIGMYRVTPVAQDMSVIDLQITKDYSGTIQSGVLLDAPYEKMNSNIKGKTICVLGDSVTLGGLWMKYMQYLYGLPAAINCAQNGRRIANLPPNDAWQDRVTVAAQAADIWILLYSANDNSSTIGSLDDGDPTTYYGGYQQYIEYMLANIPDVANKKIVLVTSPFTVGTGNTIPEGKIIFEQHYIDMANAAKAVGAKYNLPVCDLHSEMPMTWDNPNLYLTDNVHWHWSLHFAAGHIIGKFVNDLYA
jgi:hypothetical protein